jgi:flagellar hook-associated protein 1
MSSPFFGLNIASSALRTAQTLVDIANQNIANANTPGYSRQAAVVTASTPYPVPVFNSSGVPGQMGTGVQISEVTRARNTFVDSQMHGQLTLQGQVDAHKDALAQVEATINEPSTTGVSSTVTRYWAAWQDVANNPTDSSARTSLIQSGTAVADVIQSTVTQFKQQQQDLDQQVQLGVTSVNTFAHQIAALNVQISQVEVTGMHANDLRDQRDLLVDQLSSLVKVTINESSNGQVSINVGSHQLVDRDVVHPMMANTNAGPFTQVQWNPPTPLTFAATAGAAQPPLPAPPLAVATGGSMVVNGVSVAIAAGDTPTAVMNTINGTAGLGATGAVTASLSSGGALVLTSNTKGSGGNVTLGASTGSVYADLGLASGTVKGTDENVNLSGGGKLQGLIESRDQLLQERIDDINGLASRIIESVNGVQASGVGLDGVSGRNFFSGTDATSMAVDAQLTAAGGTDKIAAGRMVADPSATSGYSAAAGDSTNAVALAHLQDLIAQRSTSTVGGLAPGQTLGAAKLIGLDLSGAAANVTYTFSVAAGPPLAVSVSDGSTSTPAKLTVGVDGAVPPNQIINVDTGLGRLTLSAAPGASLSSALAGLNNQQVTTLAGPATIGNQYAQQIATLGVESQTAQSQSTNQAVLITNLNTQRQQTSGVSLDEETVNLMMYQKAFQAAARVITVMDSMLDTLVNHTGVL